MEVRGMHCTALVTVSHVDSTSLPGSTLYPAEKVLSRDREKTLGTRLAVSLTDAWMTSFHSVYSQPVRGQKIWRQFCRLLTGKAPGWRRDFGERSLSCEGDRDGGRLANWYQWLWYVWSILFFLLKHLSLKDKKRFTNIAVVSNLITCLILLGFPCFLSPNDLKWWKNSQDKKSCLIFLTLNHRYFGLKIYC